MRFGGSLAAVMAVVSACGCGGSPTAPASGTSSPTFSPPAFPDGTFLLDLSGGSVECGDIKEPQAGTSVHVLMTATHTTSGEWVARAARGDGGDVEMRLVRTNPPAPIPFDIGVTGSFSGTATDSFVPVVNELPRGSSALFGAGVAATGTIHVPPGTFADGRVGDPVTFARSGLSARCPAGAVTWLLNGPLSSTPGR